MAPSATTASAPKLEVSVDRPTPYTFDLGLLLANDPNPISTATGSDDSDDKEARLAAVARDAAQSLVNQLLTTCPLHSSTTGVLLTLPPASTPLPREKPLPAAKEPTKWELFAARKGIKPKTREQRRMRNQVYNENTGEWEKTWGFDANAHRKRREEGHVPNDWLVEVDEAAEKAAKEEKQSKGKVRPGGIPNSNKKRRKA